MKKILIRQGLTLLIFAAGSLVYAQKHIAGGEMKKGGNRLISVLSDAGKQLYSPHKIYFDGSITSDGKMDEPGWEQALKVTPFLNGNRNPVNSSVRVLFDRENIYLFWKVPFDNNLSSGMKEKDGLIVADDYVQVNLIPMLPDTISEGTGYHYSIAANPGGMVWDSYFDPYLDGFYFSSWNSGAVVGTSVGEGHWNVEMILPFSGLDVYSDPGWKWNLEFRHHISGGKGKGIYQAGAGITVQQDIMVRSPGLVSYFWPRPEFMQEVKPDMSRSVFRTIQAFPLTALPRMNGKEDSAVWQDAGMTFIDHADKMGDFLMADYANASIGIKDNMLCFCLRADGAKIQQDKDAEGELGEGMAAQMAGVNGVFVDQALFRNECFWIILQPRNHGADSIHQDYYMLQINNNGMVRGTHYDGYGAPSRDWEPATDVDLFNTGQGWAAEVLLDMECLDLSADCSGEWGLNLFRNRMTGENESELQAWRFTGGDFLNPAWFGELSGIAFQDLSLFRAAVEKESSLLQSLLSGHPEADRRIVRNITKQLDGLKAGSLDELRIAENELRQVDHMLGVFDASAHYGSVPQPELSGLPLMDIQMMGDHGWAVGAMGTILRTENGGNSWQRVTLPFDADLYRVEFINRNEGWAAGGRIRMPEHNDDMRHDRRGGLAYIFHTSDGGRTWECQFGERGRHLFALDFVDENIGYAAGERGYLMKTNDGGKNWRVLPTTGTLNWLYGIAFIDRNHGFAVGLNETVIRTLDGGHTWERMEATADKKFYGFRPIYRDICFSGNTGCIVGQNGSILISHDGGNHWEPTGTFYKDEIRELMQLRSVQFVNPSQGYAVGELGSRIMYTEDGGLNWTYRTTGQSEWLRAIWADPSGGLTLAGEREKILRSDDSGMSWEQLNGRDLKVDIMVLMAHGDDAPIRLNSFFAHYSINQDRDIIDIEVISDLHSSEYEETYNLEHDRNSWMIGVGTSTNFVQFENGNNGANYYHYTQRLWEGEENMDRQMVAAIRAYRPDIVITHGGILGDYDKPGHKVSGRSGLRAFETAGGPVDHWPELTRIGLKPWEPKKLYCTASESYPATLDLSWIADELLEGIGMTCREYGNYVIRNFQSQGVYRHSGRSKLSLIRSKVNVPDNEDSIFDGLKQ